MTATHCKVMSDCVFPFIGQNCTQTYADLIGRDYYYYSGVFSGTAWLTFCFTTIQGIRAMYFTDKNKYLAHKRLLLLSWLSSCFLVIQSLDPAGYNGSIPTLVDVLAADLTADFCLITMFMIIIEFIRVFLDPFTLNNWETHFWRTLMVSSFILSIVFSCLQVYVDRNVFRGVKLILYGLMVLSTVLRIDILVYHIRKHLSSSGVGRPTIKLDIYLILFNILAMFVGIYQIVTASILIADGLDGRISTTVTADMIIFPLTELMGIIMVTTYMSKMDYIEWSDLEFEIAMTRAKYWVQHKCGCGCVRQSKYVVDVEVEV